MKDRLVHCLFSALIFTGGLPLFGAPAPERTPKAEAAQLSGGRATTTSQTDSLLQADDVIRVQVFQEEDINKQGEVRVSKECTISLPMIGVVNLKGKTVRQAEELIRRLYDKDFLVNPQVNIIVMKFAERFVNVQGAVNKAGRVPFPPNGLTIVDAIADAGGLSRIADLKRVKLTRKNGESVEVNVDAMMKRGTRDSVQPMQLEEDDSIFVPERIL
jgi:polysaccharide biosynthesis/export protein